MTHMYDILLKATTSSTHVTISLKWR